MKAEGIWECTVLGGKAGELDGVMNVQINVQIDDGPSKGQRCTYEDTVNGSSAKYVGWSCTAVGWPGGSLKTLERDIEVWISKTGGKSTVEIRHVEIKRGKVFDKWVAGGRVGPAPIWDKCNGIGRGAPKPLAAPSASTLASADALMREAMAGGPPPDDAPPHGDDDIPFISGSMREPSAVAKVLR